MDNVAKTVKLLAEREIKSSMADPGFYEQLPEFIPLRAKLDAAHANPMTPKGCSSCAKNRAYRAFSSDYMHIALRLSPDGAARFRKYFGADEIRAMVLDRETRQPKSVTI